jgi:hypothetical protein
MLFHPQTVIKKDGTFTLSKQTAAIAHPCMSAAIIKEFWRNFSFQSSVLDVSECDELTFCVGNAQRPELQGYEYAINVTPDGICLCAETEKDLLRGFMTLLDLFRATKVDGALAVVLDCCEILDRAFVQNRMVHFCIFPETTLWDLQHFVRFCGALKYTHIVLEFWGTLKYDCLRELAWPSAYTKEQIRPIIREAKDLGLEVIPMFNHWGHASSCRAIYGKHVVLDQKPALQTYFSEDGWRWDIQSPEVRALLRSIRQELMELCGDGSYFHIGCDEAGGTEYSEAYMREVCDFINEVSDEMNALNRRVFVWGDMFLYRHAHYHPKNRYTCNAPSADAEKEMLRRLDRRIVIADWQYNAPIAPVETSEVFKKAGFDCFLCPWDVGEAQMKSAISTVKTQALDGFLHTTWHTLSSGMPFVLLAAVCGFDRECEWDLVGAHTYTAAVLRKVMPIGGDYRKAGWSKVQISCKW